MSDTSESITAQARYRRASEPEGEIERLSHQHHEIGAAEDICEGAQAGIVYASWTFHRHEGDVELLGCAAHQAATSGSAERGSADH